MFRLTTIILLLIIIPFLLFGERFETYLASFQDSESPYRAIMFMLLPLLLALDVILPVPSSLVCTMAGFFFGFLGGVLNTTLGLTLGSMLGYIIGARIHLYRGVVQLKDSQLQQMEAFYSRFGYAVIVICRAIPVLAEISTLYAGVAKFSFKTFLLVSVLSNIGVAAVYAWVGHFSAEWNSFLLAFAASIIIPALVFLIYLLLEQRSPETN